MAWNSHVNREQNAETCVILPASHTHKSHMEQTTWEQQSET